MLRPERPFLVGNINHSAKGTHLITAFHNDGFSIPLVESPLIGSTEQPLFAADSMTLLVGPNGSGKTRAMMGLVSALSGKKPANGAASITWVSEEIHKSTCAVYYTSAPYHLPISKHGHQYRAIKTSLSSTEKPLTSEHKEVIDQLKLAFGLEARKVLNLPRMSEVEVGDLLRQLGSPSKGVIDTWPAPFIKRYKEIDHIARRDDGSIDWETFHGTSRLRSEIIQAFGQEMKLRVGAEFSLKIRAYEHVRKGRMQGSTAELQILNALGFSTRHKLPQKLSVFRQRYDEALEKFRKIAAIVGDEQLKKNVYYIDDDQHERLKSLELGTLGTLSLTELSSGAAALIHQFSSIELACIALLKEAPYTNLVLMIDEGDAFLHLAWQQRYIDYLDKTAALLKQKFKTVQIIVATHSPVLMSDFPRECTFILDGNSWFEDLAGDTKPRRPSEAFGAPLDTVVREVGQTGTMGTFAANVIKKIVDDVSNGISVPLKCIEMIGDPIIRRQIKGRLVELGLLERKD